MSSTNQAWRLRVCYANPPSARGGVSQIISGPFSNPDDPADKSIAEAAARGVIHANEGIARVEVLHPNEDVVHATFFAGQP